MKPQDWHVGMSIVDPNGHWRPHVLLRRQREPLPEWAVRFTDDMVPTTCSNTDDWYAREAPSCRPATFASLSRRPSDEPEGARCVKVAMNLSDRPIGMVFTKVGGVRWQGENGHIVAGISSTCFAPLSS